MRIPSTDLTTHLCMILHRLETVSKRVSKSKLNSLLRCSSKLSLEAIQRSQTS
ncbi:hypothetical protein DPMN_156239 [Dreissena polymorpha]|uniref:Uncharacterized protein n=1 Tax=Dreissena polymorpha TaxID=45954 RepID=A0A9D4FQW0_DREPO|nr:hypothetical protein DPMN_156239 [Dreissena polymorpha]